MFLEQRLPLRPLVSPYPGWVVDTDYESQTVQLDRSLVAEEGTLTFNDPGGLAPGDNVSVAFAFTDITLTAQQNTYMADVSATANITMPNPLPANIAEYLAKAFRQHHLFLAGATAIVAGNVLTYGVIRPGYRLTVTATPNGSVVQATTQNASNGGVPNVGGGSAVFYRPGMNVSDRPTITPFRATLGTSNAGDNMLFFGILRQEDEHQYADYLMDVPYKEDCPEVVLRGKINVPLEVATGTIPVKPVLQARFAADGTFTKTGGFRIVEEGTAPPTGCVDVPNGVLDSVVSDTQAIVYLR